MTMMTDFPLLFSVCNSQKHKPCILKMAEGCFPMDCVHMENQETQIIGRKALSRIVQSLQSYKQ